MSLSANDYYYHCDILLEYFQYACINTVIKLASEVMKNGITGYMAFFKLLLYLMYFKYSFMLINIYPNH